MLDGIKWLVLLLLETIPGLSADRIPGKVTLRKGGVGGAAGGNGTGVKALLFWL